METQEAICMSGSEGGGDGDDGERAINDEESGSSDTGFLAWSTWQLIDSILPTGGFAHSYGLEAATQAGIVYDAQTVEKFAMTVLESAGALLLPFVFTACNKEVVGLEEWIALDWSLHAVMTNHVSRAASIGQGKALMRLAGTVFKEIAQEVATMRSCLLTKPSRAHGHHAVVFGRILGLLGVDCVTAQRAYLFLNLRDVLSAATRLNLIGPMEAALLQHRHAKLAELVLAKYANRSSLDAYQISPVIDTVQGAHTQLFSRLFCS